MNFLKVFSILFFSFFVLNSYSQVWIPITKNNKQENAKFTIVSNSKTNSIIKFDISGFNKKEVKANNKTYHEIDLMSDASTTDVGSPEIPRISKMIAIPDNASVSVEIINTKESKIFKNINIFPKRRSWYEGAEETAFIENLKVYNTDSFYPSNQIDVSSPAIFRDFRVINLSVSPIQYNPVTKELKVFSSISIKLNYKYDGKAINPKTTAIRPIAPSFDRLYKSTIANYNEILKTQNRSKTTAHDLMLCIVPDALYNDFLPYADWKKRSGIDIRITKFSDIGATATNPITIKNHIKDAYHNWSIPPTYILLVGDSDKFPTKTVSYDYSFVNDDYFVEIDGEDYIPEMMIGRFTNKENYRMKVMTHKFMLYEKEPYTTDSDWFKKGICCSNDAYTSQVTTKEFTRDVMINDGGFTVDAMMSDSSSGCSHDNTDVINALNEGRSYLNYRGEGWTTGWWASCTPLDISDLSSLNNGQKFTFFTSIGCGVAMFDNGGGNCFGEELIQMGTLTDPKGAIAFVGPTSNTHTTYNNKIDKGIYVGMFQESLETPGEALLRGKLYMYNVFGGSDEWVEYHYRVFTVLGDPSIHIWKDVPLAVNVTHPTSVALGENNINVQVSFHDTGLAVENAQVTITGENDLFVSGYSDAGGNVTLNTTIPNEQTLNITVRGKNVYPYLGNLVANTVGIKDYTSIIGKFYNKPNPFSTEKGTKISYSLLEKSQVSLEIYNTNGQLVRKLFSEKQNLGNYELNWDGQNDSKNDLKSGLYICKLTTEKASHAIKLLLMN